MAEYARAGLEAARVEDIVAAAGVSWGTFFHYFPAKEDVLLEACAAVCRSFAAAAAAAVQEDQSTETVLQRAFMAMYETAVEVAPAPRLRGDMLRQVVSRPGRLTAYLGDEIPTTARATTEILARGQRRGEVRDDHPAESLAVILNYAVTFAAIRGSVLGRPEGSAPLGRLALEVVLRGLRPGNGQRP